MRDRNQGTVAVMIVHNEFEYVKLNVEILQDELRDPNDEIVIVDNYSNDGLAEWLAAQNKISYIICDDKLEGYGEILKVVIEQFGGGRDLLLMRANYFFAPGSIAQMKEALHSRENVAAVGPMCNTLPGEQKCFSGKTYTETIEYRNQQQKKETETAYLDMDIVLMKEGTLDNLVTESVIPQAVIRKYMKNALKRGYCFLIVGKAVCFSVGDVQDECYRALDPKCYREEKLHQLLYSFGDISYQGIYLYKYLEPDILACINYHNKFQKMERTRFSAIWKMNMIGLSTKEQAEETRKIIDGLPHKDVLFVTLPIRRKYQGSFVHTAMETFIASIDENIYLDLEIFTEDMKIIIPSISTKNLQPILDTSIPMLYGVGEVEDKELLDFLWIKYLHPLELVLDVKFDDELIQGIWTRGQYILKQRDSYIQFYREVIAKVNPKVIIYSHGQDIFLTYLRDTALELGVPTLEIDHGVGTVDTYHKQLAYADNLVVYSDIVVAKNREQGNGRTLGIGKPGVYEGVSQPEKTWPVTVITFISSLENEIFDYARNLAERLDVGRFLVIYKAHNSEVWKQEEKSRIENEIENLRFENGACDIRDCVKMADIVVGIRSSGLFDALPYPKVKIIAVEDKAVSFSEAGPDEILQEVIENGEITLAKDEEQLYQEVINYERGAMYRDKINSFWPEDAAERFRKLVDSYL